jgi:hypothetical protein
MAGLDQTQVIAGRNLLLYTEPWIYSNTYVADSVVWGDPPGWGGSWIDLGFTRDGLRFRLQVERQDVLVDQVVDPVLRIPTRRNLNLETALAQINSQNLSYSTGQGTISTIAPGAPGTNTFGHQDYVVSGTIVDLYYTVGYDILSPGTNQPVRVFGWKSLCMADVEMQFNVTDAARIAYNMAVLPDTGTVANPISPPRVATFRVVTWSG